MSNIEPILLLGAIALVAIQVLRTGLPNRAQALQMFGGAIVGFFLLVGLTDVTALGLNLVRATHVDEVMAELERNPPQKRLDVLIIGSSRAANAIDDERLEAALERAGFPYDVRFIAAGGFFAFEHEVLFEEYMRSTDRVPIAVVFEISTEAKFELDANKHNKAEGIRFLDGKHIWLAFEHLMESNHTALGVAQDIGSYVRHVYFKTFNVGFAGHAKHRGFLKPRDGFQPFDRPDSAFDPGAIPTATQRDFPVLVDKADVLDATLRWRTRQAAALPKRGIRHALYFTPPILDVHRRAHQAAICKRAPTLRCIEYSDSDLPERLSAVHWHDAGHVLRSGATIYTDWFAERLIQKLAGE